MPDERTLENEQEHSTRLDEDPEGIPPFIQALLEDEEEPEEEQATKSLPYPRRARLVLYVQRRVT